MHRLNLVILLAFPSACTPRVESAAPAPPATAAASCNDDSDCVLQSREALGCCSPCPTIEPMSRVQAEEIARLCGLHQGGERCPPMLEVECSPEEEGPWRAVCTNGACERVRE